MLRYLTVPVTGFQQNCSIVWCDETMDAAVIDPGGDLDKILAAVKSLGVTLKAIWLTHPHIDHVRGLPMVLGRYQVQRVVDDGLPGAPKQRPRQTNP